ncbi:MAG: hypothetical protein HY812_08160 [Planctomycetes bacterium]|nr:hypothetical protein [Planctomycetota bacterium]
MLLLLALAADARGASFYGRDRMAAALGLMRRVLDQALERLLHLGLLAFRPWNPTSQDGVWQLLPLPPGPPDDARPTPEARARPLSRSPAESASEPLMFADILRRLAAGPVRKGQPRDASSAPESRGF